jgi:hypothetical protein
MIEIRRILCPIDFSDHSRRALEYALAIARWYDSEVTVVHVAFAVPLALGPEVPVPAVPTAAERQRLASEMARVIEAAQPGPRSGPRSVRARTSRRRYAVRPTRSARICSPSGRTAGRGSTACCSDRSRRRCSARPRARS